MVETIFYDRKKEIALLREKLSRLHSGEMIVLYGRRRVGKTELAKQFLKTVTCRKLYFYVDVIEPQGILDALARVVQEQLGEQHTFSDFTDFLKFISGKADNGFVLVLDEFQRFVETAPHFITQLQNIWDDELRKKRILVLLVGSSMGMIQKMMNNRAGALYGRASRIKVSSFAYADFRMMFKELSEEEKVSTYAVFGGTPYYLEKVRTIEGGIHKKISSLLLSKGAVLLEEPKTFLEYENVRIHSRYNSILQAVASGKDVLKEIQDYTGVRQTTLPAYLQRLDELLDLLKRNDPVLGKERLGRYALKDYFFKFWYRFIFPHQTAIHIGNFKIIEEFIKENLDAYIGKIFEDVCRELLIENLNKEWKGYILDFEDIGAWWNRSGEELDIVAYNKKSRKLLVGEVKWTNEQVDVDVIDATVRKSKMINFIGEYKFLFVAKKGFTPRAKERIKELNAIALDLDDVARLFEDSRKNE